LDALAKQVDKLSKMMVWRLGLRTCTTETQDVEKIFILLDPTGFRVMGGTVLQEVDRRRRLRRPRPPRLFTGRVVRLVVNGV